MTVLRLQGVSAAPWGSPLLEGITLDVAGGEVVGLAGPNGAGKSTLLKIAAGDLPLQVGDVMIAGAAPQRQARRSLARQLAFLPQLSLLNFPYTAGEVVSLGRIPHDTGTAIDTAVANEAMAAMDVADLRDKLYTQLSGGERQRVQLARVFAQVWGPGSPAQRLLLLDEPTSALDLSHQQLLVRAIRELAGSGCAIVLVIHDLNLMAGLADRVAVLHRGRLAASGTPSEVFTAELFRTVFDVDVLVGTHPERAQPMIVTHAE